MPPSNALHNADDRMMFATDIYIFCSECATARYSVDLSHASLIRFPLFMKRTIFTKGSLFLVVFGMCLTLLAGQNPGHRLIGCWYRAPLLFSGRLVLENVDDFFFAYVFDAWSVHFTMYTTCHMVQHNYVVMQRFWSNIGLYYNIIAM